jgi:hypothetical protein
LISWYKVTVKYNAGSEHSMIRLLCSAIRKDDRQKGRGEEVKWKHQPIVWLF